MTYGTDGKVARDRNLLLTTPQTTGKRRDLIEEDPSPVKVEWPSKA